MLRHRAAEILFQTLEKAGLRYAVLRNYEQYPDFGHDIDLVLHRDDLAAFRALMIGLAAQENWQRVMECGHWAKSTSRHHHIEIFRCYLSSSTEYLQVDVFHGFLLWGLPLLDEDTLLSGRVQDERGFTRINAELENLFRMLQIHRLSRLGEQEKIERYRQRVLAHAKAHQQIFAQTLTQILGLESLTALQLLEKPEMKAYLSLMSSIKRQFFLKSLTRRPRFTCLSFWNRFVDALQFNWISPCGQTVTLEQHCCDSERLFTSLDLLKRYFVINSWAIESQVSRREKQRILERGGLLIRWADSGRADIAREASIEALSATLVDVLESRHRCLYQQEGVAS